LLIKVSLLCQAVRLALMLRHMKARFRQAGPHTPFWAAVRMLCIPIGIRRFLDPSNLPALFFQSTRLAPHRDRDNFQ